MANAGVAKDLGKRSSDLLSKEFPTEYKIEWKGATAAGVAVETSLAQAGERVTGAFKATLKQVARNTSAELEIKTDRSAKVEVVLRDEVAKDLKTTVTAESNKDGNYGTFAVEYRRDLATVTAAADYGKDAGSTLKGSVSFGRAEGLVFGSQGEYFVGRPANRLTAFTVTAGYRTKEFDLLAFDRFKHTDKEHKNEVGASYYHNASADLAIATEFAFDSNNAEAKPKLTLGTKWAPAADTTVKATFDTAGKLAFSYQQKLNARVTGTLAATLDAQNFSKSNTVFGVTLALTD